MSTATHGTGIRFGNLSSRVERVRIIDARGEAVELTADSDPDGLRAARVSLGALGVITEVTVRCVPLLTIRRIDEQRPLADLLGRLDELIDGHDHFEIFAFPYTGIGFARTSWRTDEPPAPPSKPRQFAQEAVVENAVIGALNRASRIAPGLAPRINRLFPRLAPSRVEKVDRSWRVYATMRNVRFTEMEYAIPRAAGREAIERVLALIERRRIPTTFPLEIRWAAGDDALLSTAHDRDSCYVAVHQYAGTEFESYFRGVEAIMDSYDGRPHWGKRHYQTAATLAPREWDRFLAVRAGLDADGLFSNPYTDRVLGPVGAAVAA